MKGIKRQTIPRNVANHNVINLIRIVEVIDIFKGISRIDKKPTVPASLAPTPPGISEIAPSKLAPLCEIDAKPKETLDILSPFKIIQKLKPSQSQDKVPNKEEIKSIFKFNNLRMY